MKKVIYLALSVLILGFTGCGRTPIEGPPGDTRDISKFDGPYEYVKTNDDGTIVIKKDDKENVFEFLGLAKGSLLAEEIRGVNFGAREDLWLEYDENKISPSGNLQGYAYYPRVIFHDAQGNPTSRIYSMVNAWAIPGAEFVDDGQTHKHYESMLSWIIKLYKKDLLYRSRGGKKGNYEGRSTSDLESKLAEYEKMLAEYREKKDKGL